MKCYYEGCLKTPEWHIFVDPGTYGCEEHAPGDYSEAISEPEYLPNLNL